MDGCVAVAVAVAETVAVAVSVAENVAVAVAEINPSTINPPAIWDRFGTSKPRKITKMVRNGFRKLISGSRDVRKGQKFAADPLGAFPEPKNGLKV